MQHFLDANFYNDEIYAFESFIIIFRFISKYLTSLLRMHERLCNSISNLFYKNRFWDYLKVI